MKARKPTPRPPPPVQRRNLRTGGVLPRTGEPVPVHLPCACSCHPVRYVQAAVEFTPPGREAVEAAVRAAFPPAACGACGAGPDTHAPTCPLERAPHLERLLLRVRDELRVIDQRTCSTFDGHGVRALLRVVESEVAP